MQLNSMQTQCNARCYLDTNSTLKTFFSGPLNRKMLGSMADATRQRDVSAGEVVAAQDDIATEVNKPML